MVIYYALLAVAVIVVALVIMIVCIILKKTDKEEPNQSLQEKKEEIKWNHIRDFADINSDNEGVLKNHYDSFDEDIKTTGVGIVFDKYNDVQEALLNSKIIENDSNVESRKIAEANKSDLYEDIKDDTVSMMSSTIENDTIPMTLPSIEVSLSYNDGNGNKMLKMTTDKLTVGRDMRNDLILWNNIYLSRWHAEFIIRNNKLYLKDLNSKNGTYLDAKPVQGEVELTDDCEVKFGNTIINVSIQNKVNI